MRRLRADRVGCSTPASERCPSVVGLGVRHWWNAVAVPVLCLAIYHAQQRRDRRGAKRWVAEVVDLLGFFDLSADWRALEKGLQTLDRADGDVTGAGAELQRLEIVPASSTKNILFKSA